MIIDRKQTIYLIGLFLIGLLSLLALIFFITLIITGISPHSHSSRNFILSSVPKEKTFYDTAIEFALRSKNNKENAASMITPHHLLAADVIARAYSAVANDPDIVAIIGPNHFNAGDHKILTADATWDTPYGTIDADTSLIGKLTKDGQAAIDNKVFLNEHAINSQTAFIKHFFPEAKILPIILKSTVSEQEITQLISWMHENLPPGKTLVIGSMDFSHDQDLAQTRQNDLTSLKLINSNDFANFSKINVDSRGTLKVVMQYSELAGAKFKLLENTNSAELANAPEQKNITSYITGVFSKPSAEEDVAVKSGPAELKFLFFGDLMIDRHVGEKIKKNGFDFLFSGIEKSATDFFSGYDLISANLEGAVTDQGLHYKPDQAYDFAFAPDLVNKLHDHNFTYFNIANNHLSDQGERGIIETENNLSKLRFVFAGCADGKAGDCSATTTTIALTKIGLAGFSMVYKEPDRTKMSAIIRKLADSTDIVIVNIHWGTEYEHNFSQKQQTLAHLLIDNGADMVIGHHPHVVQGMEIYKNKPVFYSLGNFIFDQYFSPDTQEELGINIEWQKNQTAIRLMPMNSIGSQPQIMDENAQKLFIDKFISWSKLNEQEKEAIKNDNLTIAN